MANITLDKLDVKYQKAKEELEKAEIELVQKKDAFNEIQQKRNKRMCKELEKLFSYFYYGMKHENLFYDAFYKLDLLGIDSSEVMFDEFEKVEMDGSNYRVVQIHRVDYEKYEHEIIIPETILFQQIKEIFDEYLEKEKELTKQEEIEQKNRRYKQYLELKKEFENEESPS